MQQASGQWAEFYEKAEAEGNVFPFGWKSPQNSSLRFDNCGNKHMNRHCFADGLPTGNGDVPLIHTACTDERFRLVLRNVAEHADPDKQLCTETDRFPSPAHTGHTA